MVLYRDKYLHNSRELMAVDKIYRRLRTVPARPLQGGNVQMLKQCHFLNYHTRCTQQLCPSSSMMFSDTENA